MIPETVKLEGTIRAFDKDMENKIEKEITNTLEGIKKIYNINYELQFDTGYLISSNEPDLTQKLLSSLEKAADHHTPQFLLDEKAFKLGTETYTRVAIDYLNSN